MKYLFYFLLSFTICFFNGCTNNPTYSTLQGEKFTLSFQGPETNENHRINPFLDYKLEVTFSQKGKEITIPGYYAADGNSAETSASSGSQWQVIFRPETIGEWNYKASFLKGKDVSVIPNTSENEKIDLPNDSGIINVNKNVNYEGRLQYVNKHYLQYSQSKKYFIKGGCGSPENILGYYELDGTYRGEEPKAREGESTASSELHKFPNHLQDWNDGDPSWQNGKGKSLIGALNYLASKEINSLYFLTMNIDGDGKDVFPYTSYTERERFDVSKLAQWEIIFDHMDKLGILMQVVLQETENELLLDGGETGKYRKLYLREMIARYAHHTKLVWNMGEENGPVFWRPEGQNTAQQKSMTSYVKNTDPYKNCTVLHSHADKKTRDSLFMLLRGFNDLDGMSMQVYDNANAHSSTVQWLKESADAGKPWIISMDEVGPYYRGVDPDDRLDNNQDTIRAEALWGNLMAGGNGAEWYFGSNNHNNDLTCEDWRTRDRMWDYTAHATRFFNDHIPFHEMKSADDLTSGSQNYAFAKAGETYLVYLLHGGQVNLDLSMETGSFSIHWYNPRTGGKLQTGSIEKVAGGENVDLGKPPAEENKDWAILLRADPTDFQNINEVVCTDKFCQGTYSGPEFINNSDIAHQFSNTMSGAVGDKLKELYDNKLYSKVDFSKIEMTTEGMGSGHVVYRLKIPFQLVETNCKAYTSFDHVGGWRHSPALKQRKKQLQKALLPGDVLDISDLKTTKEGLEEYWIQWRNKKKQQDCVE